MVDQDRTSGLEKACGTGGIVQAPDGLRSAVERQLDFYFSHLDGAPPPSGLYGRVIQEVERPLLERCLKITGGNQMKAAEILGIHRNTLRRKLSDLGIDPDKA